jgi:hypothetical protein
MMGQEPGHSEVVSSLLDHQARLRAPEAARVERNDTLSVTDGEVEVVFDVPAPPVLQEPDLKTTECPPAPQTREEQIAHLAKRIDHLELELAFVAEELWRLASDPPG